MPQWSNWFHDPVYHYKIIYIYFDLLLLFIFFIFSLLPNKSLLLWRTKFDKEEIQKRKWTIVLRCYLNMRDKNKYVVMSN